MTKFTNKLKMKLQRLHLILKRQTQLLEEELSHDAEISNFLSQSLEGLKQANSALRWSRNNRIKQKLGRMRTRSPSRGSAQKSLFPATEKNSVAAGRFNPEQRHSSIGGDCLGWGRTHNFDNQYYQNILTTLKKNRQMRSRSASKRSLSAEKCEREGLEGTGRDGSTKNGRNLKNEFGRIYTENEIYGDQGGFIEVHGGAQRPRGSVSPPLTKNSCRISVGSVKANFKAAPFLLPGLMNSGGNGAPGSLTNRTHQAGGVDRGLKRPFFEGLSIRAGTAFQRDSRANGGESGSRSRERGPGRSHSNREIPIKKNFGVSAKNQKNAKLGRLGPQKKQSSPSMSFGDYIQAQKARESSKEASQRMKKGIPHTTVFVEDHRLNQDPNPIKIVEKFHQTTETVTRTTTSQNRTKNHQNRHFQQNPQNEYWSPEKANQAKNKVDGSSRRKKEKTKPPTPPPNELKMASNRARGYINRYGSGAGNGVSSARKCYKPGSMTYRGGSKAQKRQSKDKESENRNRLKSGSRTRRGAVRHRRDTLAGNNQTGGGAASLGLSDILQKANGGSGHSRQSKRAPGYNLPPNLSKKTPGKQLKSDVKTTASPKGQKRLKGQKPQKRHLEGNGGNLEAREVDDGSEEPRNTGSPYQRKPSHPDSTGSSEIQGINLYQEFVRSETNELKLNVKPTLQSESESSEHQNDLEMAENGSKLVSGVHDQSHYVISYEDENEVPEVQEHPNSHSEGPQMLQDEYKRPKIDYYQKPQNHQKDAFSKHKNRHRHQNPYQGGPSHPQTHEYLTSNLQRPQNREFENFPQNGLKNSTTTASDNKTNSYHLAECSVIDLALNGEDAFYLTSSDLNGDIVLKQTDFGRESSLEDPLDLSEQQSSSYDLVRRDHHPNVIEEAESKYEESERYESSKYHNKSGFEDKSGRGDHCYVQDLHMAGCETLREGGGSTDGGYLSSLSSLYAENYQTGCSRKGVRIRKKELPGGDYSPGMN